MCASISYKYLYCLVSLRILRSLKVLEPESVFAIGPIYLRNHQNGKCKAVLSPVHNEDHLSAAITKNCKNVLSSFPPKESFLSSKIENCIESYWLDYIEGTQKKSHQFPLALVKEHSENFREKPEIDEGVASGSSGFPETATGIL